jgi:hypothetical protein
MWYVLCFIFSFENFLNRLGNRWLICSVIRVMRPVACAKIVWNTRSQLYKFVFMNRLPFKMCDFWFHLNVISFPLHICAMCLQYCTLPVTEMLAAPCFRMCC